MKNKNRNFLKTRGGKIGIAILAVVMILTLAGWGGYQYWLDQQPKFHDVTIELGEPMPGIEAFLTEYAKAEKAELVTQDADLTLVGQQPVVFAHNGKEETVTLTIQDTTAPKVEFLNVAATIQDVVEPEDLVTVVEEYSDYTVSFQLPDANGSYGDVTVQVVVTDAHGNATAGESVISYRWMRERIELELGQTLRRGMLFFGGAQDGVELDQTQIDAINASPVGEYTVVSSFENAVNECVVVVQDTTAPRVELQNVVIYLGETAALEDFLVSATDISGDVHGYEVVLLETLPPNATEEMITSGFSLSLYTCTPGGGNRVTVRCNAKSTD
jgi:hypothetical protein